MWISAGHPFDSGRQDFFIVLFPFKYVSNVRLYGNSLFLCVCRPAFDGRLDAGDSDLRARTMRSSTRSQRFVVLGGRGTDDEAERAVA